MTEACRNCWWREGERCYNEKLVELKTIGGKFGRFGPLIDDELLACCNEADGYKGKRAVLEQVIPGNKLVITSEKRRTGDRELELAEPFKSELENGGKP